MKREATLSNLLNQTFAELGANTQLVAIYLAITIPLSAVAAFYQGGETTIAGFDFGFTIGENLLALGALAVIVVLAAVIASVVLQFWLYAGMVRRSTELNLSRFWPWIGIYILATLGITFGFLFLIVPGIIIAIRWLIVLPLVIEGKLPAMDTFGESWELTRGRSWSIFGAAVILFIGLAVIGSVLGGVSSLVGGISSIPAAVVSGFAEALSTAVFTAFAVGAYRLLRDDTEELAEVFG
ncbi:glycerophosphoryl diester phosphodiesterase membrane domain-containing protein [Erythrobacter sp. THAF29]|uniref:glycerophosphoryl diester phosphodiesterase membrane domain-containing protein n=1 Tax=Erythrobacter sp. THAF29 TaxID=2587851 RepID=UPI00126920A9|nr:glycerophosphoryl diester phosphodiesterase membrane domain-containing protein [Erythrobacter sp. THAF29]QFT77627.1 Membrane domain of glycerophosphoryl diester phosphodiesterase [Erythrobacter sp. THAF29]